jgi:hypothetical protein
MRAPRQHRRRERQLMAAAISNGRFKATSWAVWPSSRDPNQKFESLISPL